jgi:hypothetical protein
MSEEDKEYNIVLHPDSLPEDITQEELDELLRVMEEKLANGTFWSEAEEIDMDELKESDPELYDRIMSMDTDSVKEVKPH